LECWSNFDKDVVESFAAHLCVLSKVLTLSGNQLLTTFVVSITYKVLTCLVLRTLQCLLRR